MKNLLVVLGFCFSFAQAQNLYEREVGFQYRFGVSDALALPGGDLLLSSFAYPQSSDSAVGFLIKTDSSLQILWTKRYKAFRDDDFSCLAPLADGNILVGGTMRQDFVAQSGGSVYKIDTGGNVLWHKVYSDSQDDRMLAMFEKIDSSLMIFIRYGVSNRPTKVVHTNKTGGIISAHTFYNGTRGVFAEAVTSDPNEIYYMAGTFLNTSTSRFDLFVCAVNETSMLWYKLYDFGISISTHNIRYTNGQLIVGGNISDTTTVNASDVWLMKLDLQGDEIWSRKYAQSTLHTESLTEIEPSGNGDMLAFGQASNDTGSNALIFKVDSMGNLLWTQGYHHSMYQTITTATILSGGEMFLTASTLSDTMLFFTTSKNGHSACGNVMQNLVSSPLSISVDAPAITEDNPTITPNTPVIAVSSLSIWSNLSCSSAVGMLEHGSHSTLSLFPVPCSARLTIQLPPGLSGQHWAIKVMDMSGRELKRETIDPQREISVNVDDLPGGIYGIRIETEGHVFTSKFLKL